MLGISHSCEDPCCPGWSPASIFSARTQPLSTTRPSAPPPPCCRAYRDLAPLALSSACREDEFLYGRAGYLFGSLMLNTHVRADAVPAATLEAVVQKVLSSGQVLVVCCVFVIYWCM